MAISIIALMVGLAVPVLKVLGGGKSIEAAENQLAAILGRARAQAISDRTIAGVMFFVDPKDARIKGAIVEKTPTSVYQSGGLAANASIVSLDLATDTLQNGDAVGGNNVADFFSLPTGIGVQFIDNYFVNASNVEQDDRYMGFNTYNNFTAPHALASDTVVPYGCAILFGADGKLASYPYAFHTAQTANPAAPPYYYTALGRILFNATQYSQTATAAEEYVSSAQIPNARDSQFGMVVFDHDAFIARGYTDADAQVVNPGNLPSSYTSVGGVASGAPAESDEENWLDQNCTPLIIDRYDGSLIRGE